MAVVASQTAVEKAATAGQSGEDEWKVTSVYMGSFHNYYKEAMVDVVKLTSRSSKLRSVEVPSISNTLWRARDELQKDPKNMKMINNLGYMYLKEGQHEQCLNVMMRGWKRAGEIPDARVRFCFLMKTAELSMGLWKYKQALAIWRDIQEPSEPNDLKSFLLMGTQLWCNNGDLQQSLKFFQRCIDKESFDNAVRLFAVVVLDLKKVGGYEAAKSSVEQLLPENGWDSDLQVLDAFVEQSGQRKKQLTPDQAKNRFIIACVAVVSVLLVMGLFYLETHSFAAIKAVKDGAPGNGEV